MNKKLKQIAASLLSVLMIVCFMPSMAFAAEGDAASAAVVTTSDGSATYDDFTTALKATLAPDGANDATITLNADAKLTENLTVNKAMVIDLNGHKLDESEFAITPAEKQVSGEICRSAEKDGKISFAKHEETKVIDWSKDKNGAWEVKTVTYTCDNCGARVETAPGKVETDSSEEGKIKYNYVEDGEILETKVESAEVASKYTLTKAPYIVKVNGQIQHKDGKPVIKADMEDELGNAVDADLTVTAATEQELKAKGLSNVEATCTNGAQTYYKVVVKDPNGKVVGEDAYYLLDDEASDTTDHAKGELAGIKLLTKSAPYNTAAEAAAVKGAVKTTSEEVVEDDKTVTKHFAWTYGDLVTSESIDASAAVEADGSFTYMPVYYCDYEVGNTDKNTINGDAVTVKPYANATKASDLTQNYSSCTEWKYPAIAITYEYTKAAGNKVKDKKTYNGTVAEVAKPVAAVSHVSDETQYDVVKQPTCKEEGSAKVKCAICGQADVEVPIAKTADQFGAFEGTPEAAAADLAEFCGVATDLVSINAAKTEGTVTATCVSDGGTYKYCTAEKHWVLQTKVEKKGHDFSPIITTGTWSENVSADYDKTADYTFSTKHNCKNDGCTETVDIVYHSAKGTDDLNNKYSAVKVDNPAKGADCKTDAKITYTVEGLTYTNGKPVVKEFAKPDTKGDHKYEATVMNWSSDYEKATVSTKCSVCGDTSADTAKVTKATDKSGLTTYTATFGDMKETKTAYTFDNAKVSVTYDKTKITDANLVEGVEGAAPQTPEVKLTINGTEIDSNSFVTTWSVDKEDGKTILATVKFADSITESKVYEDQPAQLKATSEVVSDPYKVSAKKVFDVESVIKNLDDEYDFYDGAFKEPFDGTSYTVEVSANGVKDATVKYAVLSKAVSVSKSEENADKDAFQKKIEALTFDKDSVEISAVSDNYIYAQVSKEGYTTYTFFVGQLKLYRGKLNIYLDAATAEEGTVPTLKFRVLTWDDDEEAWVEDKDFDKSLIKFTTVGGEALDKLAPGTYKLAASAENFIVNSCEGEDGNAATLVVTAKAGASTESDADIAAAADTAAKSAEAITEAAGYAKADVEAVQAAAKELEEAKKSGNAANVKAATEKLNAAVKTAKANSLEAAKTTEAADAAAKNAAAITAAAGYAKADVDAVAAAAKALDNAKKTGSAADIQAATKTLNAAVATAKTNKANAAKIAKAKKLTVKGLKVTAGKKKATVKFKKTKGATAYQIQYRIKGKKWKDLKKYSKKVKVTAKKLKKGKKYQFKVRTITKVGKKNYYGKWTKVKTVKIKK